MAIRKSELYSSLWASCDELRGGMDASQYKDYVLVMLFIKYVSDKYTVQPFAAITVPEGASFSDLVPKPLIVQRYFADQQATIDQLQQKLESVSAERATLEEEHDTEEGALAEMDKINQGEVKKRLKELKAEPSLFAMAAEPTVGYGEEEDREPEAEVLKRWLRLYDQESTLKKKIKTAEETLDRLAYEQYPQLSEADIKTLVVDDKWMTALETAIRTEMEAISQRLTQRIQTLAERYEQPLPELTNQVATLESKVQAHLEKMGFTV